MGAAPILTILKDGQEVRSCRLEGESVLGRSEGCVIRLDDRAVSRQHAIFRPLGDSVQVEKQSEFAPLSVNGAECTSAILKEGDIVSIGPYLLRLSMQGTGPELFAAPDLPPPPTPVSASAPVAVTASPADTGPPPEDNPLFSMGSQAAPGTNSPSELEFAPADLAEATRSSVNLGGTNAVMPAEFPASDGFTGPIDGDGQTKLTSSADVAAVLVFDEGAANVRRFEIDKAEISIGRGKACDIVLNDKKSSRKNAVIVRAGNSFTIRDLGSSNGTYVNGERVQERQLAGDDLVQVGDVQFQFKAKSKAYEAEEPNFPVAINDEVVVEAQPESFEQSLPIGMTAGMGDGSTRTGIASAGTRSNLSIPSVAGIAGIGASAQKNASLVEKFKSLPPTRRAIMGACLLALAYFLILDEDEPMKAPLKKGTAQIKKDGKAGEGKAGVAFEALSPENQKFVERQHALAFDYFKNKEYDKCLFELNKIFALVPDYKNSREIERYAKEGKRKLDAIEEEKRKREEEARLKAQIVQLVDQTREFMSKRDYDSARELFSQILAVDPENKLVEDWRREIQEHEDSIRIDGEKKRVQAEVNKKGWEIYREAGALAKSSRFQSAIRRYRDVLALNALDQKLNRAAKAGIANSFNQIETQREPSLAQGREAEASGEFTRAYLYFKKATIIDPSHPEGYKGMTRVRAVLHDRAKVVYTEAVLAESFSDFALARKRFKECLEIAPEDDIYFDRAKHKLARFFKDGEAAAGAPGAAGTDGAPLK